MTDVTRGEFEMLKSTVDRNMSRLDSIDDHGTRGVAVLQNQMLDLVKDIGRVETSLLHHEQAHKDEKVVRDRNRKWFISTTIAGVLMLCAILTLLVYILTSLHGGH